MKDRQVARVASMVTASEIAAYAYCPEQWRLEHGLKLSGGHVTARAQVTEEHTAWHRVEHTTTWMIWWAIRVVLAGLVLFLLFLWGT
jgi:hypothetical protein